MGDILLIKSFETLKFDFHAQNIFVLTYRFFFWERLIENEPEKLSYKMFLSWNCFDMKREICLKNLGKDIYIYIYIYIYITCWGE